MFIRNALNEVRSSASNAVCNARSWRIEDSNLRIDDNVESAESHLISPLPQPRHCVCSWKNCRKFQKGFAASNHPIFHGVIVITLVKDHVESMEYKKCLDRVLGVINPPQWISTNEQDNSKHHIISQYVVARHHFTAIHLRKYDTNPKTYYFWKPFSMHGAKKYLFTFDPLETYPITDGTSFPRQLYLQCPNVPQDVVQQEYDAANECMITRKIQMKPDPLNLSSPKKSIDITICNRLSNIVDEKSVRTFDHKKKNKNTAQKLSEMGSSVLRNEESENKILKDELEKMRHQLSFLQEMIVKLHDVHQSNDQLLVDSSQNMRCSQGQICSSPDSQQSTTKLKRISCGTSRTELTASESACTDMNSLIIDCKTVKSNLMRKSSRDSHDKGTASTILSTAPSVQSTVDECRRRGRRGSIGVPYVIDVDDDADALNDQCMGESQTITSNWHDGTDIDWTETQCDDEDDVDVVSIAEKTINTSKTFQSKYRFQSKQISKGQGAANNNDNEDDDEDETDEDGENYDEDDNDNFDIHSLATTTIVSASKSVKSLLRETELDDDDDDDDDGDDESCNTSHAGSCLLQSGSIHTRHTEVSSLNSNSYHSHVRKYSMIPGSKSRSNKYSSAASTTSSLSSTTKKTLPKYWKESESDHHKQRQRQYQRDEKHSIQISRRDSAPRPSNRRGSIGLRSNNGCGDTGSVKAGENVLSSTFPVTDMIVVDPYGEKGSYTGLVIKSTGMPHGYGRLQYDLTGRWYEGNWVQGRWTGHGRLANGDGDMYEGYLLNDQKHGKGKMRFADGRLFEGEYLYGMMVDGKMTYQDGSTYDGSWSDGMRHGVGRCTFTDNSTYEGEFMEGEFAGFGKMKWYDGGWYEGQWLNGEMHGRGKEVRADGSIRHDGLWSKGQPVRRNLPTNNTADSLDN